MEDSCIAGVIIPEHSIGDGFWVRVRDYERSFLEKICDGRMMKIQLLMRFKI
jgi:hypothetical protein